MTSDRKGFLKRNNGISAGIISLIFLLLFSLSESLSDHLYRNGFFQVFRLCWDYTIGLLPFPLIYLILLVTPLLLWWYGKKFERNWQALLLFPANVSGWIITLFLWMWGYNYCCSNLEEKSGVKPMSAGDLYSFGLLVSHEVNDLRSDVDTYSFQQPEDYQACLKKSVEHVIRLHGVSTWGNPSCQYIGHNGLMRKLGIAGVYIPFTGEAHCDDSFLPVTRLFITAHELSHAYGTAKESEADFMAYEALMFGTDVHKSTPQAMRYAAQLELLRTIRYQLHFMNDSLKSQLDSTLNEDVREDLAAIKANALLYPEFFPGMQEKVNNQYLKAMGVQDGTKNYDRFVDLAWAKYKNGFPAAIGSSQ